ncbi:hypothetical protein [Haloarchaeobius sp. DFWS5]|uniref:hypothetical protein n=1 Tax=Haloarchaeobius sp. DFWS5 TaxID=3446114 RepID=UPI003EBB6019
MSKQPPEKPSPPDVPSYARDPLERQSPSTLEDIAAYAKSLAVWKREQRDGEFARQRASEEIGDAALVALEKRGISTDTAEYDDVPSTGAYITVKETKPGYRYYYWQWRDGDAWKNEYIAPVGTDRESDR